MSGDAGFVDCEPWPINHEWGSGEPYTMPADGFSARWVGHADFAAGSYDFIARGDDGIRVWLDDQLIIDRWNGPQSETRINRQVTAGQHKIRVESRDSSGNAVAQFRWEALDTKSYEYVAQWGSSGTGDGQFRTPAGIAVDGAGNLFVGDIIVDRVQKFTDSGVFVTKWGSTGTSNGRFYGPHQIAVDSAGNVYVVEWG